MSDIPILDMRTITIKQIHDACRDVGFFYLSHHGIEPELMNEVLKLSRLFFNMPQTEKDKVAIHLSPYCRGYGRLMAEKTKGIGDYKETYDLGLEASPHPERHTKNHLRLIGPNNWPDTNNPEMLGFKSIIQVYLRLLTQLGNKLMHLITQSLHLPVSHYKEYFNSDQADAFAMLRLLYYPASSTKKLGVGEHVDSGFIALLLQDDTGGLQIQTRTKKWIDVPPRKHHFIVNIGEMLQSWSKNYYEATLHRVVNHPLNDRISVPFFFEPNLSTTIYLPENPEKPLIYGDHILSIFERSFP